MENINYRNKALGVAALTFVTGVIVFGLFLQYAYYRLTREQRTMTRLNAENRIVELERDIDACSALTNAMKYLIMENPDDTIEHFDEAAAEIMKDRPFISSVQLAPNGEVTAIYPLEGNERDSLT